MIHGWHWCKVSDWDKKRSNFSVCQQGELMVSPWFSHVRQTDKHTLSGSGGPVPGLFFLEASNPGWPAAWRHRGLLPALSLLMCCTTLSFPPQLPKNQSLLQTLWPLTSEHLTEAERLFWPGRGSWYFRKKGGADWMCGLAWGRSSQTSSLSFSSAPLPPPHVSLSRVTWPGSMAPLHFPSWQKGNIRTEGAGVGLCYVAG